MKQILTIIGIAWVGTMGAHGQVVLAGWDFNGLSNFGPSPLSASSSATNVTVGGLTRGLGIGSVGTNTNRWGGNDFSLTSDSLEDAIAAGDFATLTITADPGYTLSFSSISAYRVGKNGTGPTTGQWQYQVGSGAFGNIASAITWGSETVNDQPSINLSSITALQSIGAGTSVTFRVATWGATGSGGTWSLNQFQGGNDFIVNGTVSAIPEPGTWALVGFSGLMVWWRFRNRRRALS